MWENPFISGGAAPVVYQICGRLVPWLAAAGIIALATGCPLGFAALPADYQQGRATALCTCMSRRPSGQWALCGDGGGEVFTGWSGR